MGNGFLLESSVRMRVRAVMRGGDLHIWVIRLIELGLLLLVDIRPFFVKTILRTGRSAVNLSLWIALIGIVRGLGSFYLSHYAST
jgi:hypothetical protein